MRQGPGLPTFSQEGTGRSKANLSVSESCLLLLTSLQKPNSLCFQEGEIALGAAFVQAGGSWRPCSQEGLQCAQAGAEKTELPTVTVFLVLRLNHSTEQQQK